MRDAIIMVGMHRSGSSALTRIFSLCGAALPHELLPPNYGNPTGYWEPARALGLNDSFLRQHASAWCDADRRRQAIDASAADREAFVGGLCDLLRTGFEPAGPLVVKDPRISLLLPYWTEAARRCGMTPKIVHVFRDPKEVASSLVRRDGVTAYFAVSLWIKHNLVAERDGRGYPRAFVAYEDVLTGWDRTVARCAATLAADLTVTAAARVAAEAFLLPRTTASEPAAALGPGPTRRIAEHIFELLRAARDGVVDEAAFDALAAEQAGSRVPIGAAA
jgi:hypothetical protein